MHAHEKASGNTSCDQKRVDRGCTFLLYFSRHLAIMDVLIATKTNSDIRVYCIILRVAIGVVSFTTTPSIGIRRRGSSHSCLLAFLLACMHGPRPAQLLHGRMKARKSWLKQKQLQLQPQATSLFRLPRLFSPSNNPTHRLPVPDRRLAARERTRERTEPRVLQERKVKGPRLRLFAPRRRLHTTLTRWTRLMTRA